MSFVDLWGWFANFEREAIQKGDVSRQRLVTLAYEGWKYQKLADGENAIRAFDEALKLAKRLNEPCWEIFHQHWIDVIRLFVQYDYQNTLDGVVRLVAEIRKEKYKDCRINCRIVYMLAEIYFVLDFHAYESEILGLLDYLEKEMSMDEDTYLLLLLMTAEVEVYHERYAEALEKLQYLISQSTNKPYRLYDGYYYLRRIAFIQGDIPAALNYNRLAQTHAQATLIQDCIATEKLWEAVLLKYLGEDTSAREKYHLALAHYERYKLPLEGDYRITTAEYLELDKQVDGALKSIEALLSIATAKPSIANQIDAYCAYIALLGRSGRDFSEPLTKAKAIANSSLKPETHLQRLARIEAGNYFDFEWQKTSRKGS